jgi:hypothetical protein
MLQRTTKTSIEDYRTARREAHKTRHKTRKKYEEEIIQTMQTYSVRSESRKIYQGVTRFRDGYQPRTTVCRDKEGTMVDGEREVMNTWSEYFTELLNKSNPEVTVTGNDESYDPQNRVQKLTPSVIYDIIKKLKKNKSPGEDVFRPNC